ncbi:MAG: ATP synthase F0 subunit B [Myxococcota bacterium]|nr:ATP synthase F0 subunit B [Myxococcota bacterium]
MLVASRGAGLLAAGVAPPAINVDVDLTFVVQLVLFVGLTLVLKPVLFDPMLRLFEERERRIDGAKVQARKMDDKSATALATYEGAMAKARVAAVVEREKIRAEGVAREQQLLGGVRAASAKVIDDGKRAAQADAERVRATLKTQTREMARDLASRVLGREVQP